jgi:hypothetical protein
MNCLIWGALGMMVCGGMFVWAACALASKIGGCEGDDDE